MPPIRIAFVALLCCVLGVGVSLAQPAKARRPAATLPVGAVRVDGLRVTTDGRECTVRSARVPAEDAKKRFQAVDDPVPPDGLYDTAAFVNVPTTGDAPANVVVTYAGLVRSATLLPATPDANLRTAGHTVSLTVRAGQLLTLELNGDITRSLHLFAGPLTPVGRTPGAIVFGPGVHYVKDTVVVTDGQTVEIDENAIVYATPAAGPLFKLTGKDIVLRGRGILDGSMTPRHTRHLISIEDASGVIIDGPTLRDCSIWNLQVRRSEKVTIRDVKIFGHRANSDGIDVCNSRGVLVESCFARALDDGVVIKTDKGQGPARDIEVRRCVLWNAVAHALSIGAEVREPVERVTFKDCDVIHDTGREWTLRVFNADSGPVRDVRFEDIRVHDSSRLISLWLGETVWSAEKQRGTIRGVTFGNVRCDGGAARVELTGADAAHDVAEVTFGNVTIGGTPLTNAGVTRNAFVRDVRVQP